MSNSIVWNKHDFAVSLRKRINKPSIWKDILEVKISDVRTFVRGALTTEGTPIAHVRGTAYTYQDMTIQQDTGTINQSRIIPLFVDWADLAQQSYVDQMKVAELQGKLLDEAIEALVYANHSSFTDFGVTDLADGDEDDSSQIAISVTNIDNLVRQVRRKVRENNGSDFMAENGIFFSWTASEFAMLEEFAQANGFTLADLALKNGIPEEKAFKYFGSYHYMTTQQTANHRFAGVRKLGTIGLLRSTWGVPYFNPDPAGPSSGAGTQSLSGLGIVTRADYGFEFCGTSSYYKEFWMDINTTV